MNHYDLESGSRPEKLVEFKVAYGNSLKTVMHCLEKYFPEMPIAEKQRFLYTFFPFMFGIYPYAVVTEKQRATVGAVRCGRERPSRGGGLPVPLCINRGWFLRYALNFAR